MKKIFYISSCKLLFGSNKNCALKLKKKIKKTKFKPIHNKHDLSGCPSKVISVLSAA